MRRIGLIALPLMLAACSSNPQNYVGLPAARVFLAYGSPQQQVVLPQLRQALVYTRADCRTTFFTDPSGTVVSAAATGQSCPAAD
ncbi:hypothetical protein [Falsiroseomonas sp. HW251]|uniref:hypothetical protein n=1 Tax=Falsiroseomonas sp. HW251 TaxID=3390998 RepID=UPI003D3200BD